MPQTEPAAPSPQTPREGWRYTAILELLTKVVLLGGPVFYVLGRIYSESYWAALDVPSSVMAVAAEDYVYYGFIVVATGLTMVLPKADFGAIWVAPLAAILILGLLGTVVWLLGRVKQWMARKLRKFRRRLRVLIAKQKPALQSIATAGTVVGVVSSLVLALLLFSAALLLPIVIAHSVGEKRAGKVMADFAKAGDGHTPVEVDGVSAGRLVDCNAKYCVVYASGKFRPVRLESVRWPEDR
jgi:hypothetical protein